MNLPRVKLSAAGHELDAYVARTSEERALGLMHRAELPESEALLFLCEEKTRQSFWMKDTPLPLSAAFIDDDGTILEIADLAPHDTEPCRSAHPVRYVLEANQGWFSERGIAPGTRIAGPAFAPAAS